VIQDWHSTSHEVSIWYLRGGNSYDMLNISVTN
jgi:hypothetical protein